MSARDSTIFMLAGHVRVATLARRPKYTPDQPKGTCFESIRGTIDFMFAFDGFTPVILKFR